MKGINTRLTVIFTASDPTTSAVLIVGHLPPSAMRADQNHRIMPVAKGSFTFNLNTFAGQFDVDGTTVVVNGSLSEYVPFGIFVPAATVTYRNINDFIGTYAIRANDLSPSYLGTDKADITFERGGTVLRVKGKLARRTYEKFVVNGSGDWYIQD